MSTISELADRLRVESKSMGKFGVDYMATLLMQASDTITMLSEKARADRPQEWIPCSERLPEEDGDYLVSLAFEWGNEIEMGWLLDGEWVNPNSHVTVAWQPLPKPWKGADDE